MKITAFQVAPEWQNAPLTSKEDYPENVILYGNNRLNEHNTDQFNNLPAMLDDIAEELTNLRNGKKPYTDFDTILEAFTGKNYTRSERLQWAKIVERWTETDEETEIYTDVLTLLTGTKYDSATLRGSCQGDWQYIIYPAEYGREWLNAFETEYFNLGTEWKIREGDDTFEYYVYCVSDDPRAEIANYCNADTTDIILYEFAGWERTPKYTEVQQ